MSNSLRSLLKLLLPVVIILLIGCGGGGDDAGPSAGTTTSVTISGTVSGTTMNVYNMSGTLVASSQATGIPKTFTVTVPVPGTYKFYLVENEGTADQKIYPLYQSGTNVFQFDSSVVSTRNLGYVDTKSGVAVPQMGIIDTGVTPRPADAAIPAAIATGVLSLSDFVGSWRILSLATSPISGEDFWGRQVITVAANGAYTVSEYFDSGGGDPTPESTMSVLPSGVVRVALDPNFRGYLSSGKNVLIGASYMAGEEHDIKVGIRIVPGASFSSADLAGTWYVFGLTAGTSFRGWERGKFSIAANTLTWEYLYDYQAPSTNRSPANETVSINASGIVTFAGRAQNYTVMSADKTMMAAAESSGDRRKLYFLVKVDPGVTFTEADCFGAWQFYNLDTGAAGSANSIGYGKVDLSDPNDFAMTDYFYSGGTVPSSSYPVGTYEIDADGAITHTITSPSATYYGVLSPDKKISVLVGTRLAGEYMLGFLVK
jgi:hypothetical protein